MAGPRDGKSHPAEWVSRPDTLDLPRWSANLGLKSLKTNVLLSTVIAITGICVPIGLSFILKQLAGAISLQSFAASAALSATSLGSSFTILSS
ncbi:hypothetical protein N7457_003036 [Penicillium paradoxum]|uniref:uncharacterized protein n=1 Tax=Penicillium paradoxum TaxID=176176 RepID=UPI0025470C92|nr:uncharacterized protein N7457_003036 [Penicillium paradoxum]KAJ5788046.1 hypothetical protein N7457_003036 [Penicillium paradoxum]